MTPLFPSLDVYQLHIRPTRYSHSLIIIPRCLKKTYSTNLPTASVVIIFRNEAFTVLLRTMTSVINRSPPNLLHEIILVDDFSDHGELEIIKKYLL